MKLKAFQIFCNLKYFADLRFSSVLLHAFKIMPTRHRHETADRKKRRNQELRCTGTSMEQNVESEKQAKIHIDM